MGRKTAYTSLKDPFTLLTTFTATTHAFHNPLRPRQDIASSVLTLPKTTSSQSQASLLLPTLPPNISSPLSNSSAPWLSQYLSPSYIFPTTVLQIPVATVCPYPLLNNSINGTTPSTVSSDSRFAPNIPAFAYISLPSLLPSILNATNSTNGTATNLTVPVFPLPSPPVSISLDPTVTAYNATVNLPNGQSTTFLSRTLATPGTANIPLIPSTALDPSLTAYEPAPTDVGNANQGRIVQGDDNCQTLFSALTTSVCSTTVAGGGGVGLGPVTQVPVTDCAQWVRFSSAEALASTTDGCSSASAAVTGVRRRDESTVRDGVDSETPTAYYAALWHELVAAQASGTALGVPRVVSVETCVDNDSGGGVQEATESCWGTSTELWTLSSVTRTKVVTSVAGFSGPAVLTASQNGQLKVITTSLNVANTTVTSSITVVTPTILRHRLNLPTLATVTSQTTVTVAMTGPTVTQTISLVNVESSVAGGDFAIGAQSLDAVQSKESIGSLTTANDMSVPQATLTTSIENAPSILLSLPTENAPGLPDLTVLSSDYAQSELSATPTVTFSAPSTTEQSATSPPISSSSTVVSVVTSGFGFGPMQGQGSGSNQPSHPQWSTTTMTAYRTWTSLWTKVPTPPPLSLAVVSSMAAGMLQAEDEDVEGKVGLGSF